MDVKSIKENFYGKESYFATRLRYLLKLSRMNKSQLSNKIGVSRQAVSQYCDGTTIPNADTLLKIAEHFDVSIDYLSGRTNEKLIKEAKWPCNIGDTLYSVGSVTQDIVELTVEGIQITKKDTFIFCHGGIYVSVSQQLNKSVFRTREEAEEYRGRLKNDRD